VSTFYLGTHQPHWLWTARFPIVRLPPGKLGRPAADRFVPAACGWALDSGGFTELSLHGRWVTLAGA